MKTVVIGLAFFAVATGLMAFIGYFSKNLKIVFAIVAVFNIATVGFVHNATGASLAYSISAVLILILVQHMIAAQFHLYFKAKRTNADQ